jgi:hypothetical protein
MYTVQDHPPPPSEFLLLPSLDILYKTYVRNQDLNWGILDRLGHRRNTPFPLDVVYIYHTRSKTHRSPN